MAHVVLGINASMAPDQFEGVPDPSAGDMIVGVTVAFYHMILYTLYSFWPFVLPFKVTKGAEDLERRAGDMPMPLGPIPDQVQVNLQNIHSNAPPMSHAPQAPMFSSPAGDSDLPAYVPAQSQDSMSNESDLPAYTPVPLPPAEDGPGSDELPPAY